MNASFYESLLISEHRDPAISDSTREAMIEVLGAVKDAPGWISRYDVAKRTGLSFRAIREAVSAQPENILSGNSGYIAWAHATIEAKKGVDRAQAITGDCDAGGDGQATGAA